MGRVHRFPRFSATRRWAELKNIVRQGCFPLSSPQRSHWSSPRSQSRISALFIAWYCQKSQVCKNGWLQVVAMGTNKRNNHGDLKNGSLGWFIHIFIRTHIYIHTDVSLSLNKQCQQQQRWVCLWACTLCASTCTWVGEVSIRCHSSGISPLTFWDRVSYWDWGFTRKADQWVSGISLSPLFSAGIKSAHYHMWIFHIGLGSNSAPHASK